MDATGAERLLMTLLEYGRKEDFSGLSQIPNLENQMYDLLNEYREQTRHFADSLEISDRIALTKAVTIAEGSLTAASPTSVAYLLEPIPDPDRELFAWVLEHSKNGYYYGHGAKSFDEYDRIQARRRKVSEARREKEDQRQVEDKHRIAENATQQLFNAVRRGDLKAVHGLIAKGADVAVLTPDGQTLLDYARSKGDQGIIQALQPAGKERLWNRET